LLGFYDYCQRSLGYTTVANYVNVYFPLKIKILAKEKGEFCTFFAISSAGEIVTLFLYNIAGTSKMLALAGGCSSCPHHFCPQNF
jgi:hypothetical protein